MDPPTPLPDLTKSSQQPQAEQNPWAQKGSVSLSLYGTRHPETVALPRHRAQLNVPGYEDNPERERCLRAQP